MITINECSQEPVGDFILHSYKVTGNHVTWRDM